MVRNRLPVVKKFEPRYERARIRGRLLEVTMIRASCGAMIFEQGLRRSVIQDRLLWAKILELCDGRYFTRNRLLAVAKSDPWYARAVKRNLLVGSIIGDP